MFSSLRRRRLSNMIKAAKTAAANHQPIPLDIYAALDAAGVNIEELERNARNGKA